MALKFPESMDECIYFTRRADDKSKIIAWTAKATCPKCKKGLIASGKSAWGCLDYKNGCDFKIPFVYRGVRLTPKEAGSLLKTGKTAEKYVLENSESEEAQHISLAAIIEVKNQ